MNRFDSAFSSRQRSVGRWLQALLLTVITTAGLLTGISVKAQTVDLLASPGPNPVCAGQNTTLRATLAAPGINIGYAVNGVLPAYAFALPGGGEVNLALDDDEVSAEQNVAGQFRYHGRLIDLAVDGFYVGSNGFITFRNDPLAVQIAPRNLGAPGLGATYDAIYLANTDLSPQVGGQIWYELVGTTLIVTFDDVPFFYPNPPGPIPPGMPNPATVSVQLVLHLEGDANPGQIDIFVEQIDDNLLNVQAAQDQHTIGLLSSCQPPAATIGQNQRIGGPFLNEVYSWVPAAPALDGTQTQFFRCPTPNVPCLGTGGTAIGTVVNAGPTWDLVTALPAATVNQTWTYYGITTLNNCTTVQTADYNVVANAQPVQIPSITGTQNICQGATVQYVAVPSTATSTLAWSTTAPGATIILSGAQNQIADIQYPAGGSNAGTSYDIQVTETGPAPTNCQAISLFTNRVTIYSVPVGPLTVAPGAICAVATGSNNVTYSTPAGYGFYAWAFVTNTIGATFPAGSTNTKVVTVTNQPVQPAAAATVTVQVQAFNGPGNICPGPVLQTSFTVNPLPPTNAVAGSVASVCAGTNMTYSITNNGGTGLVGVAGNTYTYTASGLPFVYTGASAGYPNGTPLAANVVANQSRQLNWTAAGTGTMTVLETTASGCTRSYSTTTTVFPLPTPAIVGANTPCQFVASAVGNPSYQSAPTPQQYSYTLNTPNALNGYRWVVVNGSIVSVTGGTPTNALPNTATAPGGAALGGTFNTGITVVTVQWPNVGAGSVTVVENTVNGCQALSTLNVTVTATPPAVNFGITGSITPCAAPGPGNVVPYSTIGGPGTHTITVVGGTITAVTAPFVIGTPTQATGVGAVPNAFTVTWGGAGTGTISDEYTDAGCAAVETYTVTINPNPTFSIGAPAPTLCGNQNHTFSTLALVNGGGAPTYLWAEALDVDGIGTLGANGNPTMIVTFTNPPAATSSYSLTLTVTNTTTGCAATVTQAFTINQVPSAPVITPVATSCAASPTVSATQGYTITTAQAGSLSVNVTGAPVGTVVTGSPFAQPAGAAIRFVTWGQLPQNPALAPQSVVVTINAQLTSAAGCVSLVGSTNTTLYARPAAAPVTFNPVLPFCVNTPVPINVTVATNGGLGQPGVNYTWAAAGVTLNAAGAPPDLARQITNLGGAGAKSITVTGTDAISGCATSTVTNFVVDPVPTPSIAVNVPAVGLNPNTVCQNLVDPVGLSHAGPFTYTYDFATPQVLGNTYSWQISNGYIVAYSTNNGGGYITVPGVVAPVASQLLPGTLNASRVRVVFYGASPAKIKVTEVHPGGCGATTPDYNVTLNVIPTQYALGVTPQDICNTGTQTAPLTLANSQVGYSYQVQRSTNGGGTWTNATVAAQNGTGAALNFVVPTADLAFTTVAPAPTVYLFRVVASNLAPVCGPYIVSTADATVNVHQIPNAALAVTIAPTPVCFGDLVNVTVAGSENWVTYELFRRQIRDNATGAALPPAAFVSTGISAVGTGGALLLADNTNPVGGFPLLAAANYEYEVVATSNTNPPACSVILTQHPTATVFALPIVQANSYTPNPVCWEQPVIFTQAGSQDGVTYEILRNGVSMAPAITFNGTGGAIGPITIPALSVLPANPVAPTNVNFEVRAQLRTGGAPYNRPIPASACPVSDAPGTDVTVNPKPVAAFTGSNPVCGPSVGTYTATTPSFGGWPATYDWQILGTVDGAPNNPPTGTTPLSAANTGFGTANPFVTNWGTHLLSCNGTYNPLPVWVRMIETNLFGCPDTAIVTVTVNPTVSDASISGPTTACIYGGFEEHLTTYTVARAPGCVFPAGTTYLWNMPTGPVVGVIRSGQNTTSIVAEWHATGGTNIGQIQLAVTLPPSHGGCVTNLTYNVTVYPQPQPVITGPTQVCQNSTGSPTSTSIYTATLFTGDTYKWDVVGGTITTPGGATGTGVVGNPSTITAVNGNSITVTWGTTPNPNATITLTQTSVVGCINRTTLNVNVNPTPNPVINGPGVVCDNAVASYSTANNAPANSYAWTMLGGSNATITAGANQATATVLTGAIGGGNSFTLQLVETTNATTCSKTVTRTITIVPTPAPTITRLTPGGATGGSCLNQVIQYGQTDPTAGTFSYKWTATSGMISDVSGTVAGPDNGTTVYVKWNTVGTGTITLAKWHTSSQCTTTVSQNVTITNPPAPAITGPTNVCGEQIATYSTPNVVGNTYSWSFSNGSIVSGSGTNALTIKWTNPAVGATSTSNVTVTETNTLSGCTGSATVIVTIRYQPQVQTITGPTQVCAYNAVTNPASVAYSVANNPGATYQWTATGATIISGATTNAVQVRWTTIGTQTLTVVEKEATGLCSATSTLNVAVTYMPAPSITGNLNACSNSSETYSTPAVAGSTYAWTVSGTGADRTTSGLTNNSITVQWLTAGPRTLTVIETAGLCTATATANVTVTAKPAPVITRVSPLGLLNQACLDETITYSTPNGGSTTYLWTVTGGTITGVNNANAVTINWTAVGNQTLTVVETSTVNTGCIGTTSQSVSVEEQPNPVISGGTPVCSGSTQTYSVTAVAGHTYNWSITGLAADRTITTSVTGNSMSVTWNNAGSYTVSVLQTNNSGNCSRTANLVVTVQQTPTATAISRVSGTPLNQACNGETISYSTPANGASSYLWTVVGGSINGSATGNVVSVTWQTVGNNTITVTETTTGTPCFKTVTQNVAVTRMPTPTISGNLNACSNSTEMYSTPAQAGSTYAWTVSGTATDRTIASGTTNNTITVLWLTAGTRTLTVTETAGLCVVTTTANVTVTAKPAPVITRTSPAGLLNQACLDESITYSTPNLGGTTYLWTVTGGTITGVNNASAVTVNWTALGNQTLTVVETATANTGCVGTTSLNVSVEEQPNPVISGGTPVCSGTTQTYSVTAVPGHTYNWTVGGTAADRTIVSSITGSSVTVTWNNAGTFAVGVTQTNVSGNCFRSATLNVTVQQTPTATAISRVTPGGAVNQACQGQTITYSTPPNGASSFLWTATGGVINGTATTNTVSVTWQTIGNNTLTVTETTTGTPCFKTVTQNVAVSYTPTPTITGSTVVCINKEHTYSTPAVPGSTYAWVITPTNAFATIAGYPASNTITVRWIQPGLHTMTVTETALGGFCTGVSTVNIRVNPIPTPDIQSATGYGNPISRRPGIVCNNSTHVYSVTPTPGNVFQWVVTGGTITAGSNTNQITVLWGAAGNGTIACTETVPGSDCITTETDTILIRPTPTPVVTGQVNPCGNSVQDYTTPFVSGNAYTWTVVGGTYVNLAPNTIRVTWSAPVWPNTTAATVSVREDVADVLPAGTCFGVNTLNVTIRPIPPTPSITGPSPVCATDLSDSPQTINTATYTSSIPVITAGSGSLTPSWTVTNGVIVSGQGTLTIGVQWANSGLTPITGNLTVTHTSSFGCSATGSLSVTINPLPNPVISGPRSACQNSLQNYSTPGIPGNTYSWAVSGGNIIRAGQGTPNVTVEWTLPGAATLTVTEVNGFLCTVRNTIDVVVNALPNAVLTASGQTTFCQGGDVTLSAPIGFSSYIWNTGETARSIVVRTTGKYWCTVTDENGCSNSSDTIQVNVFPSSLPIIAINAPTTFCEGGSVTLTAPSGFNAYLWSNGAQTQSIVVTQSGSYTVTVADNNGCTGTSTEVDVVVNPTPAPVLTLIGSANLCSGDSVEVRAPAGFVSYTWVSTSGTNYGTSRSIVIRQTDTVYCQVVDVNGCVGSSDTVGIAVAPVAPPVITANGPTTFCEGGAVTLTAPAGYASYIWSNGSTGRTITVQNGGEFWVTVTNNTSCPANSTKTVVTVNSLPVVPTISRMGDVLTANSAVAQSWQWFRNGTMIAGATAKTYTVALPGSYRVEIADNNTCASVSEAFDVILTDVDEDVVAGRQAELRVFPNPSNGQFSIETTITQAGPVRIELVNAVGELVMTLNEAANGGAFRTSVDMGILANGVYNVVVTTGSERWVVRLVRR